MLTLTERFVADIEGLSDLPSLSPVLAHLIATLGREDASVAEVAAIIRQDPVIAARVLRSATSAAYIGRSPVSSIRDALLRLGLARIPRVAVDATLQAPIAFAIRAHHRFDQAPPEHRWNAAIIHLADHLVSQEPIADLREGSAECFDGAVMEILGLSPDAVAQIVEETRTESRKAATVLSASSV